MIKRLLAPVDFSDEAFALDLVKQLGPGGVYLDQLHTVQNMRKALSLPLMSDRDNYDGWYKKGHFDSVSGARAKVEEILACHKPASLPQDVHEAMKEVVTAYSG
jgi:trimethylamine--corrinoid protein Co-methyltransferase